MQTEQNTSVEQLASQAAFINLEQGFDFTTLASGTPIRVSPKLIDDLTIGGNKRRDKARSEDFSESIRTKGVVQSLSVRPHVNDPTRLELCAGYGRRDKALEFDLASVPVIVNVFSDKEALAIMMTENRDRQDTTIVDEADLAQTYLSFHDGDYHSAAVELGLSEKVFRERLQLKRCTENVLNKLAEGKKDFTLGHALILSTFDDETQEKTLAAILANPSEYTVKELKLRASQRQIALSKAPFDTKGCDSCQYNTGEQLDLLGDGATDAKCSRAQCFVEKAQKWVREDRVAELSEKYGKVILWEAKPESDRREINETAVGKKQFKDGCMSCENKCVIVDDRPMRWGQFIENQCIDTDCFNECANAHKAAERKKKEAKAARAKAAQESKEKALAEELPAVSQEAVSEDVATEETKAPVVVTQEEPVVETAPVKRKTSAAVLEDYRTTLRATSASVVTQDPQFRMALALASLCDVSGYKVDLPELDSSWVTFNEKVLAFMDMEMQDIQMHMGKAVIHHATVGDKANYNNTDLMIAALKKKSDGEEIARTAWTPTKERIGMYNIAQIKQMCSESGFEQAYEKANGDNSFTQLFNNRKDDIVEGVMDFAFDWTNYAPSDYIALLA